MARENRSEDRPAQRMATRAVCRSTIRARERSAPPMPIRHCRALPVRATIPQLYFAGDTGVGAFDPIVVEKIGRFVKPQPHDGGPVGRHESAPRRGSHRRGAPGRLPDVATPICKGSMLSRGANVRRCFVTRESRHQRIVARARRASRRQCACPEPNRQPTRRRSSTAARSPSCSGIGR